MFNIIYYHLHYDWSTQVSLCTLTPKTNIFTDMSKHIPLVLPSYWLIHPHILHLILPPLYFAVLFPFHWLQLKSTLFNNSQQLFISQNQRNIIGSLQVWTLQYFAILNRYNAKKSHIFIIINVKGFIIQNKKKITEYCIDWNGKLSCGLKLPTVYYFQYLYLCM